MRSVLLGSLLSLVTFLASAQVSAPKYSNEFLNLGIGARSIAMAKSVTASSVGVEAALLNPAGAYQLSDDFEASFMHAEYFAGIAQYDYLAGAMYLDTATTFTLSVIRFGVDDIPDTRYLFDANGAIRYDNITFFSAADYAAYLTVARKSGKVRGLSYGGSLKFVYRNVGSFASAWGAGIDAGIKLERKYTVGITLRDITNTYTNWYVNSALLEETFVLTDNEIPDNSLEVTLPKILIGICRDFQVFEKWYVLPELGIDITTDGRRNVLISGNPFSIDPHFGLELSYNKIVFVRGGIGEVQRVRNFEGGEDVLFQTNFGVGVKIKRLTIDYALTDLGDFNDALFSNIFSLKVALNKPN